VSVELSAHEGFVTRLAGRFKTLGRLMTPGSIECGERTLSWSSFVAVPRQFPCDAVATRSIP
jgi:hypothetical protein